MGFVTNLVGGRRRVATLCGGRTPIRRQRVGQRGATLVEVAVYLAVTGIIIGPMAFMVIAATRSTAEGDVITRSLERNRSCLDRLKADFRRCLTGTITVTDVDKTLTFTLTGGFDGTSASVGNIIRYEIQDDPDDAVNGSDDDGNGLVDEKNLVRINQTTGETLVLAANVDGAASGFAINGTGVRATFSTFGWAKGSSLTTEVTQTVVVFPRN